MPAKAARKPAGAAQAGPGPNSGKPRNGADKAAVGAGNGIVEGEAGFQRAVVELAEATGWLCYSIPDSRRASSAGFPDLVLAHQARRMLIFAELKTEKGNLRREQKIWLDALAAAVASPMPSDSDRAQVCVFRPHNWPEIEKLLRGK